MYLFSPQDNSMDNELMNLALLSKPQDMIDVARSVSDIVKLSEKSNYCGNEDHTDHLIKIALLKTCVNVHYERV